jgi:hypothetical protein
VATQSPYREMDVWVEDCWIDRVLTARECFGESNSA